jgi:hypothetical protein
MWMSITTNSIKAENGWNNKSWFAITSICNWKASLINWKNKAKYKYKLLENKIGS